ncbi:hypothetical protein V6N13_029649 [Hibiscus sabdariffa]
MCKCRLHGTFPLFGLQSSHLNICYYHQDLHRRPLRPGSRPGFYGDRRALLLIGAWSLPQRPGIGHALKRHPFSGLVDSADERFARQYRCGPPPEFPLASPRSGIVHHLPGPDRHALTRTLLRRSRSVGGAPVRDPANQLLCTLRVFYPIDSHTCQTPWSVFQDGPDGEPACRRPKHAGAVARRDGACWVLRSRRRRLHGRIKGPSLGRHHDPRRSTPRADRQTGSRRSTSDRGASPAPIRFPPDNFKHSLTLFSKSFSSFPRGTCSLSVSRPYLALDKIYRPIRAAFPNNPTRRQRLVVRQGPGTTGLSPSPAPLSRGLGPGPPLRTLLRTTIRTPRATDFQAGLFPAGFDNDPFAGSPTETLLRLLLPLNDKVQWTSRDVAGSEPPTLLRSEHFTGPFNRLPGPVGQGYRLVEYISVAHLSATEDASPDYNSDAGGDRFSSWAIPGSLAVTKGILAGFDNDPFVGSPTETLLRLLLPLNDKVQWTSRDVAGSEPPTSPQSEHFTGPFNL